MLLWHLSEVHLLGKGGDALGLLLLSCPTASLAILLYVYLLCIKENIKQLIWHIWMFSPFSPRVTSVRFWPIVCMQGMTTHFKTSKALKVRLNNDVLFKKNSGFIHAQRWSRSSFTVVSGRSRRRRVRMPQRPATTSWWPCRCESSTSTCAGWPKRTLCGLSSGGEPWRTEATPPAAASSESPRRRSWRDRRRSYSRRWTSLPARMPAWGWSWMPWEPSTRPCSVLPELWPVGPSPRAKGPPPVSSPSSSPPTTTPTLPLSQPPPSVDRTGLSPSCLVLTGSGPTLTHSSCTGGEAQ